jgi:phage/plasmid-like protein (TIGR03299 family)
MAHEVENMVSARGKVPWHGVGHVLDKELISSEEIMNIMPEFNFTVEKRQNFTYSRNGNTMALEDSYSLIRVNPDLSESVLCGTVGRNYVAIQNKDAFKFFDNIVGEGEAIYETAGILKNGRIIFLAAVLPEYIKILGHENDTIRPYLLLSNWHDGTSSLRAMFTPVRVVCNNTLNMALGNNFSQVSIRHTASAEERMYEASRLMGIVNQFSLELNKAFNKMALAKISSDDIVKYVNTLIPLEDGASDIVKERRENVRNSILELAECGQGAELETAHGTVWGAFNAFTEYVDHFEKTKTDSARTEKLLFGSGRLRKQQAFDLALALADEKKPVNTIETIL